MTEAAKPTPEPEPRRKGVRKLTARPQSRRDWFGLVGKMAALVGLVTGVVTLLFLFFPGLKPVHVDVGTAAITDVQARQPVTLHRYLQETESAEGSMSPAFLNQPGVLVSFHYQLDGFGGRKIPLRWELNNAKTNDLVAQDQAAVSITPTTNSEGRDWYVWVPQPKRRGRYYITVTLYQPEKQLVPLKHFDTKPFTTGSA
jgi:hypothetical protein